MRSPDLVNSLIKKEIENGVRNVFGDVESTHKRLRINNVTFDTMPDTDDFAAQRQTSRDQGSYGVSFYGNVELINKQTGTVIDNKKIKLGFFPIMTNRYNHIMGGKEYSVSHLMRLKPGIYTIVDNKDQPTADFNLSQGKNMSVYYNTSKQQLYTEIGSTNVPLTSLLFDGLDLPKSIMDAYLPKNLIEQELSKFSPGQYLSKIYEALLPKAKKGLEKKTPDEMKKYIKEKLDNTRMDSDITELTIGHDFKKVDPVSLLTCAKKVMAIYRNEEKPSYRDNLAFKEILGTEDFVGERFSKKGPEAVRILKSKMDTAKKITDLHLYSVIQGHIIDDFFKDSTLVNHTTQSNIMEMLENSKKITPLAAGEGGISSPQSLAKDSRKVNFSQIGFIDLVRTPDNLNAGLDLRLANSAWKNGKQLNSYAFDRNGKSVVVTPRELYDKYYTYTKEPEDAHGLILAFHQGNVVKVKKSQIDYFFDPELASTVTTSSLPYLESNYPVRVAMGAKMHTQSLSLVNRENPLISNQMAETMFGGYLVPKAKVDGVITKVNKDSLLIKDNQGIEHKHNFPKDFHLNEKSFLDTELKVKEGDSVKKGDVLGDHNFSRNGTMALGTNLNVAFLPMKGWNYEDAIVLTQQGANKLTSQQIYQMELELDEGVILDQHRFIISYPNRYPLDVLQRLQDGVIKVGATVNQGDPLILALKKRRESLEAAAEGKQLSVMAQPYADKSLVWKMDFPGVVTEVLKNSNRIKVIIKAETPVREGDKLANRLGGKGVVSLIIPNDEAPRKLDGTIPDIFLNTSGIQSRKNAGQVHETLAAKTILQTGGDRQKLELFHGADNYQKVLKAAEKAGVKPEDDFIDPVTGKVIPSVLNGTQYFLKLFKQVEASYSARSGGTSTYDIDLKPTRGGIEGSKAVGSLDFFALAAHKGGNRNNLKEMATIKSEYSPEVWQAIYEGKPIPDPKASFAFNKMMTMLKGAGIKIQKDGGKFQMMPHTDKEILQASNGKITEAKGAFAKDDPETGLPFRPEKDGLFDPKITGGLNGKSWSHIELPNYLPNALHEKSIRTLLDLKKDDLENVVNGKKDLIYNGTNFGKTGDAIHKALKSIDVKSNLETFQEQLDAAKSMSKKDTLRKKIKLLNQLNTWGEQPHTAYTNKYLSVIPPEFRPIYPSEGRVISTDSNYLYQDVIKASQGLKSSAVEALGEYHPEYHNLHKNLSDTVKKLQGLDNATNSLQKSDEKDRKGFIKTVTGTTTKNGYFQQKLMSRVQDVVGRGVLLPDPTYHIDEVGLPDNMAWKFYGPYVIGNMVQNGMSPEQAALEVKNKSEAARNIRADEMSKRPVIINRAPSLHKFNMVGLKPIAIAGKSIKTSPLICKGMNADYDGDNVNVHVPVMDAAVQEAWNMLPSKNVFNSLNNAPIHVPGQETIMGAHMLTTATGTSVVRKFSSKKEAMDAYDRGEIKLSDKIEVAGL